LFGLPTGKILFAPHHTPAASAAPLVSFPVSSFRLRRAAISSRIREIASAGGHFHSWDLERIRRSALSLYLAGSKVKVASIRFLLIWQQILPKRQRHKEKVCLFFPGWYFR
jgi:hypothetical protein